MSITTSSPRRSYSSEPSLGSEVVKSPPVSRARARPAVEASTLGFEKRMIQRARTRSLRAGVVQRAFDVVIASVVLVVAAPLMVTIALLVRLTSRGPAVFRQTRIGRWGHSFECLKFRTMATDAEERLAKMLIEDEATRLAYETDFKFRNDPRITSVGRRLRRTSLDELPQLINVLRGDMSIVGPRPVLPEELGRYGDYAQIVLQTRPGMTGAWQVGGRSSMSYMERVRLDVDYALTRTLARDIGILRRTVRCVARPGVEESL